MTTATSSIKDYSVEAINCTPNPHLSSTRYKLRFYVNTGLASLNIASCSITIAEDSKSTSYFKDITTSQLGSNSSIKVFEVFLPPPTSTAIASYIRVDDNLLLHFAGKIMLSNNEYWSFSFPIEFFKEYEPEPGGVNVYIFSADDYEGHMIIDGRGGSTGIRAGVRA